MSCNEAALKQLLDQSLDIVRRFEHIIDTYVLDFYVENHWSKLPSSWRTTFQSLPPHVFGDLLCSREHCRTVWPLSLLAVKVLIDKLTLNRTYKGQTKQETIGQSEYWTHSKLKGLFSKQVKPKKMHEMDNMAKLCADNAIKYSTCYIVDFGAGVGHLARRLAFGYRLKVCCLEMQDALNTEARQMDQKFYDLGKKCLSEDCLSQYSKPIHLTMTLSENTTPNVFLECIRTAFGLSECEQFTFGIVGLHPCGNLTSVLIKLFQQIKEAIFLNIVGCCYMKLSTGAEKTSFRGYPLSRYLLEREEAFYRLSYESREIACHAIENYWNRLKSGDYEYLKVHAYRAAIERIIVQHWPHLKHVGLRGVKNTELLCFPEYARLAVAGLNISLSEDDLISQQAQSDLDLWKHVVIFYTVRLMFAPLIESIIVYDRLLCLNENETEALIKSIFDPTISPRNHILIAGKSKR